MDLMGWELVALLGGAVSAFVGGELFVKGVVVLSVWLRVPAGIVASTVAAFATSGPELTVAITSAVAGVPEISLGDALGSNIVNIGLILSVALFFGPLHAPHDGVARDFKLAMAQPFLIALVAFDGIISQFEGLLLLLVFGLWIVAIVREGVKSREAVVTAAPKAAGHRALLISLCLGLVLLVVAGKLIVLGATGLAQTLGVSEFVVGAVVVAFGTGVPELATVLVSRLRGYAEVGLGTIIGSNIFNGLFIVPLAALISPIKSTGIALTLLFGFLVLVSAYPPSSGLIGRGRGVLLIGLYGCYVLLTLLLSPQSPG